MSEFDYILVGGGLAGSLVALALAAERPEARVALVEREAAPGGNHVWCFHADDVVAAPWLEPLVTRRWPGYSVHFPRFERWLSSPYAAVTSSQLASVVTRTAEERPGFRLLTGCEARSVTGRAVTLADGRTLTGEFVFDGRGPQRLQSGGAFAYQKFVGLELRLSRPSSITQPILMDARVPQSDGFRFIYCLPFAPDRILVEDTYFSDTPELNRSLLRQEVLGWALRHGLVVDSVLREEHGVLPLPLRMAAPTIGEGVIPMGYGGGWFHPTTGYSFPVAARFAGVVAREQPALLRPALASLAQSHGQQLRFAAFLNRLLFGAFSPEHRRNVLERFYQLPEAPIRRFYAMTTTRGDRARVVCGRPPRGFSLRVALTRGAQS